MASGSQQDVEAIQDHVVRELIDGHPLVSQKGEPDSEDAKWLPPTHLSYSAVIPASRTTFAHFLISLSMYVDIASGVPGVPSVPSVSNNFRISGD
jgi:hypothetical protein